MLFSFNNMKAGLYAFVIALILPSSLAQLCPLCNNIPGAMRGIDVPGIPLAKNFEQMNNPIRQPIFQADDDVDGDTWYTTNILGPQCQMNLFATSYSNFKDYVEASTESFSEGTNLQVGNEVEVGVDIEGVSLGTTVPPIFTASWGSDEDSSSMQEHFNKHGGSVSFLNVYCNIYQVNIVKNNEDIKFHPNFITAIRDLDNSRTEKEKRYSMQNFITSFGTHYGEETIMGIGLQFESRFTEEETLSVDDQTRNGCTTKNGFKFLGIQFKPDETKCEGSLGQTTTGSFNGVQRFVARSVGSFISNDVGNWIDTVQEAYNNDNLYPVTRSQKQDLILNLFDTKAFAKITHDNGDLIDVAHVTQVALEGYKKYCKLLPESNCEVIGCDDWVYLRGLAAFYNATVDDSNRLVFRFKNVWTGDGSQGQLFFKDNHWYMANDEWDIDNYVWKSAPCPTSGATFVNMKSIDHFSKSSWRECASTCAEKQYCNFWQYDESTTRCDYIEDYESIESAPESMRVGTKDCPGSKELRSSVFGTCVENHPNMWMRNGEEFFDKELSLSRCSGQKCSDDSDCGPEQTCNSRGTCCSKFEPADTMP